MKRILHTILMLLVASVTFAQSYPRKCTEEDIPSSERQRYYDEAKKHVTNYYLQIPAAIGDLDNREVLIDAIMATGQSSLKPEFLLDGIKGLTPISPDQYFSKLDTQYKDMVDEMEFQVSNISLGDIMMKTGVSCYIPVEYDLALMTGDKTLFKRKCRMYCLFPRLAASKLIKTMQVEPVKEILAYQPLGKEVGGGKVENTNTVIIVTDDMGTETISQSKEKRFSELDRRIQYENTHQNGYEYVDLGLSVLWATCNLGASTPEAAGNYYAWGEISTKKEYLKKNSLTHKKKIGNISQKTFFDAATNLQKSPWRIPTEHEVIELKEKCTWQWDSDRKGAVITGPSGNSIFLPAGGWYNNEVNLDSLCSGGYNGSYWTSTPDTYNKKYMKAVSITFFNNGSIYIIPAERFYGYNIRPVLNKKNKFIL